MKRQVRRRAAMLAEQRLAHEHDRWQVRSNVLVARCGRHRTRWLLGGGFVAGAVVERLPLRSIGAFASLCFSTAMFVLRLPLGALLAGSIGSNPQTSSADLAKDRST
jgi:hypothetical protein